MKNSKFAVEIRQKKKQDPKKKTFLKDKTCPKDAYLKI